MQGSGTEWFSQEQEQLLPFTPEEPLQPQWSSSDFWHQNHRLKSKQPGADPGCQGAELGSCIRVHLKRGVQGIKVEGSGLQYSVLYKQTCLVSLSTLPSASKLPISPYLCIGKSHPHCSILHTISWEVYFQILLEKTGNENERPFLTAGGSSKSSRLILFLNHQCHYMQGILSPYKSFLPPQNSGAQGIHRSLCIVYGSYPFACIPIPHRVRDFP